MSTPVLNLHGLKIRPAGQQPLSGFLAHWPGASVRFWCKFNPQEWNGFGPGELCQHLSQPGKMPKRQKVLFSLTTHCTDVINTASSLSFSPDSSRSYLDHPSLWPFRPGPAVQTQHPRLLNFTQRKFRDGLPYSLLFDCEHNPFAPLRITLQL